jgi:FkbM family methyltransferase
MGMTWNYSRLFKDIEIYFNSEKISKAQKKELVNSVFIDKVQVSHYLLTKTRFRDRLRLPIIGLNYILNRPQNEDIGALISNQFSAKAKSNKLNFERIIIENNTKNIEVRDKKRDIALRTKNRSLFDKILPLYAEVVLLNQYNATPEKIKGKVVVDAGSNIGEFAVYCARLGAKKVYAFEPVSETFKILQDQIKLNKVEDIVVPVKMGLGDKNEKLSISFEYFGDGAAKIGGNAPKSELIRLIRLDDFCKKENIKEVGFIKMDIEGYEENAIMGAKNVIKRDKPALSFSAYHRPNDKKILPEVVLGIRPDYNIKLLRRAEEDFYCE